jgi:putative hydrolase of the HAD superfamily
MTDRVDALVFDLDHTLCAYRPSGEEILSLSFEAAGTDPLFAVEEYYDIFDDYVAESDDGRENRARCFEALAAEAGRSPEVGRRVADAYAAERDHENVRWVPGAKAAIESLSETYPLALVTNGAREWQSAKLRGLGIEDRFETVVYAGYETAPKPEPEPFRVALDALDATPDRAVKIGNSLDHDVAGARNAGLRSVWLDRDGVEDPTPTPDVRIESMEELLDEPWG